MSTPVEERGNPFADPPLMARSPLHFTSSDEIFPSADGTAPAPSEKPKGKKRVGFNSNENDEVLPQRVSYIEPTREKPSSTLFGQWSPDYGSPEASGATSPSNGHSRSGSGDVLLSLDPSKSHLPELSEQQTEQLRGAISRGLEVPRPRPAIRLSSGALKVDPVDLIEPSDEDGPRARSARAAFERGKRMEQDGRIHSAPGSRRPSPRGSWSVTPNIQLQDLNEKSEDGLDEKADHLPPTQRPRKASIVEAVNLVRSHTDVRDIWHQRSDYPEEPAPGVRSGAATPTEEQNFMEDYQPQPHQYRGGILGALLKLYNESHEGSSRSGGLPRAHIRQHSNGEYSAFSTPGSSPPRSGSSTPTYGRSWFHHKKGNPSTSSLGTLVGSSSTLSSPVISGLGEQVSQRLKEQQEQAKRPGLGKRTRSSGAIDAIKRVGRSKTEAQFRITNHIAETIARQKYLLKLCKALMQYGAPTHRLEEYMTMSARVLETDAQFLYIPGAMIVSFEDRSTHTSEVKLVKAIQGLDLGKLRDVHEIYKEVIHDKLGVGDALERLTRVTDSDPKHSRLVRLPFYGLAALCVGPFAFGARLIDLPICFFLGCILGILQLYVAPASDLYNNVFEISAAVITSFLARAFGSIRGGDLFCFAALAQSSIALILPGYTVLCASLELQSKSIVAGSVRMVYAIIYSLFLGYGITIGSAIYGLIDKNATSQTTCQNQMPGHWFFAFVPGFAMCLIIINQAKWKQAPVMLIIAFAGYVVNYFSSKRFTGNTQVSNTLGALVIGVLANLYSRVGGRIENRGWDLWEHDLRPRWKKWRKSFFGLQSRRQSAKALEEGSSHGVAGDNESTFQAAPRRVGYGLAAAAMLPAIFVQVPSGLSVNGSLISGIASANQIAGTGTNGTQVVNTTSISATYEGLNSIAFTVGYSVIQVAIGITVGLFLSAIVVYPFGKRRSGLFSF